ncbi:MAG: hypothetical protein KatS3mg019_2161 [Fimbriimonadales bacterium]|nr:MAG: hypothetical protein KatS3mg019_2161 [Fimbriimonadales bacterium]
MVFLMLMAFVQLAIVMSLLIVVIRERWPWLLAAAFIINEATLLYFWAAPLCGQDPYSLWYLFWVGPLLQLVSGVLLNLFLPPLPARLRSVCHPLWLMLVYLLILFLWIPFVIFGFFIGDLLLINKSEIFVYFIKMIVSFLGVTLLFIYLYRAGCSCKYTSADLWAWWVSEPGDNKGSGSPRDGSH